MKLRPLGTSGIEISPIIMGTWQAGKDMWAGIDDNESIRAIRAALDAGITTFDSAEVYGNGHSEKIIARALRGRRRQASDVVEVVRPCVLSVRTVLQFLVAELSASSPSYRARSRRYCATRLQPPTTLSPTRPASIAS